MPGNQNQNIKQKQYCSKFNKDLKMVHLKISLKSIYKNGYFLGSGKEIHGRECGEGRKPCLKSNLMIEC